MAYLGNAPVVGDSTNSFRLLDDIASFTLTFDATDTAVVSIANDTLSFTNHRFVNGQKVTYTDGGGTAIGGLSDGTSYFIIKVDQNTIKLATNASNAASSTAINLTSGAAGGSHTLNVKFDGVNTKFKATFNNGKKAKISRAAQLSLSINGVVQQPQDTSSPSVGYGVEADSTIVFSTAPVATDVVFGSFIGEVAASFDIEDNTVDNFTGDGSTTIFNLSKEVPSSQDVLVTIDGVTQYPSDGSTTRSYSVIDQALTFVSAPADGAAIQARHIGFAGATTSAVTGLYGRTGNVALISTDDISVQNISGVGATFTSNVNIEGVLTYEDVTNVDSVGLITARSGISVSGGDIKVGSATTLSQDNIFTTGIVTATSFDGSLNASQISSGTVPTARLGSGTASSSTFLRGDSTFQTVNTDLVSDTSPQLGGNLDVNTKNIVFGDSSDGSSDDVLIFGAGSDLKLYHNGSDSIIQGGDPTVLRSNLLLLKNYDNTESYIRMANNGAVELYYDNSKMLETTSAGVTLVGEANFTSQSLKVKNWGLVAAYKGLFHANHGASTAEFIIINNETNTKIGTGSGGDITLEVGGNYEKAIFCDHNGAVELYHDNTKQCETSANGLAFPDGKGIDFSATADGGSGSVDELLDDYEVGTFTATVTGIGGGTNPSFSAQSSSAGYARIGGFVHVYVYLFNVNVSSSGSGTICTISGLPFASGPHYYPGSITHDTLLTGCAGGYVQTNSNSPHFIPIADGTTSGKLPATGNTKYIMFAANYYTTA